MELPRIAKEEATTGKRVLRIVLVLLITVGLAILGEFVGGVVVGFIAGGISVTSTGGEGDAMEIGMALVGYGDASVLPEGLLPVGEALMYLTPIGVWAVTVLFLWLVKRNRPILGMVTPSTRGNTFGRLACGLAIGLGANALCVLAAVLLGNVELTFSGASFGWLLLILLCVFVQSSSEELLCRCYLLERMSRLTGSYLAGILVSGILFALAHLGNPGIGPISLVNIFLSGMVFSIATVCFDSPWMAFGIHTAWNFCQNILFGLPNSGMPAMYSLFGIASGTEPVSGFAYDVVFGVEGSAFACIVLAAVCAAMLAVWRAKGCPAPTDRWSSQDQATVQVQPQPSANVPGYPTIPTGQAGPNAS